MELSDIFTYRENFTRVEPSLANLKMEVVEIKGDYLTFRCWKNGIAEDETEEYTYNSTNRYFMPENPLRMGHKLTDQFK